MAIAFLFSRTMYCSTCEVASSWSWIHFPVLRCLLVHSTCVYLRHMRLVRACSLDSRLNLKTVHCLFFIWIILLIGMGLECFGDLGLAHNYYLIFLFQEKLWLSGRQRLLFWWLMVVLFSNDLASWIDSLFLHFVIILICHHSKSSWYL